MPAQNLLNRRRRKHPPVRFDGGAAALPPPSPPNLGRPHASQQQPHQKIRENPLAEMETVETDESGTDPEEFDEVLDVSLSELRSNVQCPICLGIIKKTRTVMGCLHRFCRECIDKSMRLGNNECPACRMHCASRRSLRDDLDFDTFISSVYPNVEKYEEEELVLHEEEKAVNDQIQASITQISLRQSEALVKARKIGRDSNASTSRVPRSTRRSYYRRSEPSIKFDDSSKNQDESDGGLTYECQPELNQRTRRQCEEVSPIHSPRAVDDVEDAEGNQDSAEPTPESTRSSPSLVKQDFLSWGRAGVRSNTRYGTSSKAIRSNRIKRLADHLANVEKNEHEHVGPAITAHLEGDQIIWLKDYRTSSSSNASSSIDVLRSPPEAVKRFTEKFNSITIPPWILG